MKPYLAVVAVMTPLLYALSVGPVVRLADQNRWDLELVEQFYGPLIWVCKRASLEGLLHQYLGFWLS